MRGATSLGVHRFDEMNHEMNDRKGEKDMETRNARKTHHGMKIRSMLKAGEPSCPATSNGKKLVAEVWNGETGKLTCIYTA
jgi:hypothetical protein